MKKSLTLLLCFAIVCMISACGRDKVNEVNIAYFDNITHGQALIMKNQNSLQKLVGEDINVNWVAFNAGPAEVEACFSGDIDIGYIGPVPASVANVKSDGDFVIISSATNGGAVLIARKDGEISSVKDLSGKTVAIPGLGNTQHLLLIDLLKSNRLSPVSEGGEVNVMESGNSYIANLMNSGEVDAALVPEPWGSIILKNTESEIILDYNEINDGESYSTAVVLVNKEYMQEHEDIVKKFLQAHIEATNFIVQYPREACKIMNEQLDEDTGKRLEEDVINQAVAKIDYSCDIAVDSVIKYSKISKDLKFINQQLKEDAFDSRLLDEFIK